MTVSGHSLQKAWYIIFNSNSDRCKKKSRFKFRPHVEWTALLQQTVWTYFQQNAATTLLVSTAVLDGQEGAGSLSPRHGSAPMLLCKCACLVSQKEADSWASWCVFTLHNFGQKCEPFYKIISPEDSWVGMRYAVINTPTSPAVCCYTTLWNFKVVVVGI